MRRLPVRTPPGRGRDCRDGAGGSAPSRPGDATAAAAAVARSDMDYAPYFLRLSSRIFVAWAAPSSSAFLTSFLPSTASLNAV